MHRIHVTDDEELHHANTPPNTLSSQHSRRSLQIAIRLAPDDRTEPQTQVAAVHISERPTFEITAMSSAAPSDGDLFEGEFAGFIRDETQFKEGDEVSTMITPDYVEVKTFGGLTDQMMDNEKPEKRLVLIHNGKNPSYVETKGPGGHTILRGLDGQTVNEEEEQERKEMEELATQIAAEEEMMKEEED
ncbi:hypothetical protein BLNAU_21274 [Blattamonas nauphoetae]|uniref:Uncharacterized protein n=1 Tax=Blattamonas nauphoetae TaxID=2049346 RepID=A0ABQ9WZG2_9EUKA|nr:hypothetical protein BLNAU_21274 [Blattamonas nauphoetae]